MTNAFLLRPLVPSNILAVEPAAAPTAYADVLNDMIGVQYISGNSASTDLLDVDFGAATAIDTVALLQTNGSAATLLLRGATTRAGLDAASDLLLQDFAAGSELPTSGRTHALGLLSAPQSFRWWRIGFQGLSAPIQIGRMVMGVRFTPEVNFSFGASFGATDLAGGEFNRRGIWLPQEGVVQRTIGLRWPHATRTESEMSISRLLEQVGNRTHILACVDPDPHPQRQRRLYFGRLRGNLGQTWNIGHRFEWRADLDSVI